MRMSRKRMPVCIVHRVFIGVATMAKKKALFLTLVDRVPRFGTH